MDFIVDFIVDFDLKYYLYNKNNGRINNRFIKYLSK